MMGVVMESAYFLLGSPAWIERVERDFRLRRIFGLLGD